MGEIFLCTPSMNVGIVDSITLPESEETHTIDDCIPALLDSNQIFIKVEPPDVSPIGEFEEEIGYTSGNVLFGDCLDDVVIKEEPGSEENFESISIPSQPVFVPVAIKDEPIDEAIVSQEVVNEYFVQEEARILGSDEEEVNEDKKEIKDDPDFEPDSDSGDEEGESSSEEPDFSCTHCPRKFQDEASFKKHCALHTSKFYACSNTCLKCPSRFPDQSQLNAPVKTHDRPYYCKPCQLEFPTKILYSNHLQTHENGYRCLYCPKIFARIQGCNMHMKTHSQFIPANLSIMSAFQRDIVVQKNEVNVKFYPCNLCGAKYLKQSSLNSHFLLRHPNSTSEFKHTCKLCPKTFPKELQLSSHIMYEHHGRKDRKCKLCNEAFKLVSHLKTHLRMCGRGKPYSCLRCSAKFKRAEEMRRHFKAIHPDTVYTCAHCYVDFHRKRLLQEHIQTHPRVYPCTKCPVVYNLEVNLKKHLELHAAEKTFGETGREPNAVAKFVETRKNFKDESAVMFSCGHCPLRFKQKTDLANHLKTHYMPMLPGDKAYLTNPFRSPFRRNMAFSLAQELKKNFANLRYNLQKN